MKRIFFCIIFILVGLCNTSATVGILSFGYTPSFTPAWKDLQLGAGGYVTGLELHSDGTTVARIDVNGAYLYVSSGSCLSSATTFAAPCWQQLMTTTAIPGGTYSAISTTGNLGVAEISVCDNNTNVAYSLFAGVLYVTTNLKAGSSLTWTALTNFTTTQNSNDQSIRYHGHWMACDPNNPDVLYVSNFTTTYVTTNGRAGGATTTFTAVSGLASPGICDITGSVVCPNVVSFDPASSVTGGKSNHLWIAVGGTGVYESTNGSTFSLTASTPTHYFHMVADKFSQLWIADGSDTLRFYKNGTGWSSTVPKSGTGMPFIALDPNSASQGANHIAVTDYNGQPSISSNNGSTWTNPPSLNQTLTVPAGQPSWLATANLQGAGVPQYQPGDIWFDWSSNLWMSTGVCVFTTPAPVATNATPWSANCAGQETLVDVNIVSAPGNVPLIAVWDRGVFTILNPDEYPTSYWNNSTSIGQIQGAWALDYASSNTNFFTMWEAFQNNTPGYSADGGTTWTAWPTQPASTNIGGAIAASTPNNWIAVTGYSGQPLTFTTNKATTWASSTIPGTPRFISAAGNRAPLAADRVTANKFCVVDDGQNFYSSTNSGATFTATGATSASVDGSVFNDKLTSVPGNAGHYFYSAGNQGGGSHPTNTHLWKSTDSCATWTNVNTNLQEVVTYGFGAAKPGGSGYPVIYAYGWLSGVQGMHASYDSGITWATINVPAPQQTWPIQSFITPQWIAGDMNTYGRIMVGLGGAGATYIDVQDACPAVYFTNVAPTSALSGTVTLTAKHSGLVPVTGVTLKVDSTTITTFTGNGPYSTSWNASGVTPGAHTLTVEATGNCSTKGSFSIPITTS